MTPARIYPFKATAAIGGRRVNKSRSAAVLDWLGRWGIFGESI